MAAAAQTRAQEDASEVEGKARSPSKSREWYQMMFSEFGSRRIFRRAAPTSAGLATRVTNGSSAF